MKRFRFTSAADRDLAAILAYYRREGRPGIHRKMLGEFMKAITFLAGHPQAGHRRGDLSEDPLARFWPMGSYLVIYREGTVPMLIIGVLRGDQDNPTVLDNRGH